MFPEYIDNTMRSRMVKCPRAFYYGSVRNLSKHEGKSIHLHAGGCYARGLEITRKGFYVEGLSPEKSLISGKEALAAEWGEYEIASHIKTYKTLDRMIGALDFYFQQFPMTTDFITPFITPEGEHCIEFKFGIPIPECIHPDTGKPITYCGRTDMIADYQGRLIVEDDKTTGQLGSQWMNNWHHDAQMTGYCWAARSFGYPVTGAILRGVSILSEKYDKDGNYIMGSSYGKAQAIVTRSPWEIQRWYDQLVRDINRAILAYKEGYWDFALDKGSCNEYGGCQFLDLCDHEKPEPFIENNYVINIWNPLD